MIDKNNLILDQLSYNIDNFVNTCSYIYIMPFQLQISYCNGIQIIDINVWSTWNILNKVLNSYSFMDMNIHVYLEDFQEAITSSITKINLFVEFESLVLNIQLASLYPSSIVSYLI